jgi:SAM-dependent methyltransferase
VNANIFDRSGIAALDDLTAPECRELFLAMEREQAVFLTKEDSFRSPEYKWPRDPLHTWSRCWEYPYVYRALSERFGRPEHRNHEPPLLADVGSGVTFFPFVVAKLGCRVVCTDLDPICERDMARATGVCPCLPGEVRFRRCSQDRLPFADEECDGVYCISVLEHVPNPMPTVHEIFRILKPGGLFCLTIDLDLRGDLELGPAGYSELHRALRSCFELAAPVKSVHPRNMLTSTTGPYPVGIPPGLPRLLFQAKQVVKPLIGRRRWPADPFVLTVEGTLWRKR